MKTEIKYDEEIENFHLPRWNELPNVDLYLDQVVTLLENYLSNYIKEENDFFTLHVFENNYGAVTFYENRGLIKKEESVHEDLGEVEYLMYYRKKKKEEE